MEFSPTVIKDRTEYGNDITENLNLLAIGNNKGKILLYRINHSI